MSPLSVIAKLLSSRGVEATGIMYYTFFSDKGPLYEL